MTSMQPLLGTPKVGTFYHVVWTANKKTIARVTVVYPDGLVAVANPKTNKSWNTLVKWSDLRIVQWKTK